MLMTQLSIDVQFDLNVLKANLQKSLIALRELNGARRTGCY